MRTSLLVTVLALVPGCPAPTANCPPGEHALGVFCFPDDANLVDASTAVDAPSELDAPATDAPGGDDAPAMDAPATTDAPLGIDASGSDAGPMCGEGPIGSAGWCGAGTTCECCPAGGPLERCVCTTPCTTAADCTDPTRTECEIPPGATTGFCRATTFTCCWLCG